MTPVDLGVERPCTALIKDRKRFNGPSKYATRPQRSVFNLARSVAPSCEYKETNCRPTGDRQRLSFRHWYPADTATGFMCVRRKRLNDVVSRQNISALCRQKGPSLPVPGPLASADPRVLCPTVRPHTSLWWAKPRTLTYQHERRSLGPPKFGVGGR